MDLLLKLVETKKYRCTKCKGIKQDTLYALGECEHHPDIFVDLTNGQNKTCDALAKQKVAKHYGIMFRYFRAQYVLKTTNGGASTPFTTADQNSIFTAFNPAKLSARPTTIAAAITM